MCTIFRLAPRTEPSRTSHLALLFVAAVLHAHPAWAQPTGAGNEWTTPAGTVEGTRYSALDQINIANARLLTQEFSYTTGVRAGHQGAPLVVGSTMYVVTPFPNRLIALDLAAPGTVKWTFNPNGNKYAMGVACCDISNRGPVYANGKIIYNVLDNTVVAVDAVTGRQAWRRSLGNPRTGQTMVMGPLVVRDKVFVGNSGAELGIRGWVAALNINTGVEVWRAWSTGPDTDVRIGATFHPFYAKDRGRDLGVSTWPADAWKLGGATVWAWLTYDPQLNLLYHGTANPGVWNAAMRPGDNKWSSTIFARNPDSGEAAWAYQMTPADAWDFDSVNENIVVDLPMGGVTRKVIVHFNKNGFAYTMDRATGEVLVAETFVPVNWASGVDLATGLAAVNLAKRPTEGNLVTDLCPAPPGGKDMEPAAFSPVTKLFYVPAMNVCADFEALKAIFIASTPFVGASVLMKAGPGTNGNRGELVAWDAAAGTKKWGIQERFPVMSGALATAGNLVFYGTMEGVFKAVNAATGAVLFQTQLPSGIVGNPMTFLGPDGKQRVAVYSGVGGLMGGVVTMRYTPDDPYAGFGTNNVMSDLPRYTRSGGAVHVFKLP